jgi:hypothetical protein
MSQEQKFLIFHEPSRPQYVGAEKPLVLPPLPPSPYEATKSNDAGYSCMILSEISVV